GNTAVTTSGSAQVFDFNGTSWVQTQYLSQSVRSTGANFGYSVSLKDNVLVVSSPNNTKEEDETDGWNTTGVGGSWIFVRNNGTFSLLQKLVGAPTDRMSSDNMGWSMASHNG
ncbi:hypothetical protein, partial [Escherichia coli]|uniref:hypothetical protein n=1 Tax=Escherichia coli TaxID=562 RepID=UPI0019651E8A